MSIQFLTRRNNPAKSQYATANDFCNLFAEDVESLYLLAFILTGSQEQAELCFLSAIGDCTQSSSVFHEWARSWARRVIIQNAVRMIGPRPGIEYRSIREFPSAVVRGERKPDRNAVLASILALEAFERVVFIVSVLEGHQTRECAILLGCTVREVDHARVRAFCRMADFTRASDQPVNELSRMVG